MPWVSKERYKALLAAEAVSVVVIALGEDRYRVVGDLSEFVVSYGEILEIAAKAARLEGVGDW